MRTNPSATEFALVALIVLCATTMLFAVTIRGSSGNGEDSGAPNWLLLGRSKNLSLNGNGKTATMRREIVCPNQDVENALPAPVLTLSGSCNSGASMLVYQLQSTAANLAVAFKSLAGFDGTNANNFGVMICDSPNNTIELCTNAPASNIPNITTTTTKNSVTFTVPGTFPAYPAGTAQQGQGLTFFVIIQQTPPLPLGMQPTVVIQ
ncbi:MAG: hypothetical protein ACYDDS_21090 [Candidatus Sulfotelmatobacter sp.]